MRIKAVTPALVTVSNPNLLAEEVSALNAIKKNCTISVSNKLSLKSSLSQSMHTFTTVKDKVSFVLDVVRNSDADVFSEFGQLIDFNNEVENEQVIKPHSDLSVMNIGSCMRKLSTFQCPYNLKCQDGVPCPYHTLTGREDELFKVEKLAESIDSEISVINQIGLKGILGTEECREILEDLMIRRENVSYHLEQSKIFESESESEKINLLMLDKMKKPKMLSTLFALEHLQAQKKTEKK